MCEYFVCHGASTEGLLVGQYVFVSDSLLSSVCGCDSFYQQVPKSQLPVFITQQDGFDVLIVLSFFNFGLFDIRPRGSGIGAIDSSSLQQFSLAI